METPNEQNRTVLLVGKLEQLGIGGVSVVVDKYPAGGWAVTYRNFYNALTVALSESDFNAGRRWLEGLVVGHVAQLNSMAPSPRGDAHERAELAKKLEESEGKREAVERWVHKHVREMSELQEANNALEARLRRACDAMDRLVPRHDEQGELITLASIRDVLKQDMWGGKLL